MLHATENDATLARRFLQLAGSQAGEAGISLACRHHMPGLAAVNRENRDSWPPLIPLFDAAHSVLTPETAFWVDATNEDGETIGTYAARFFQWSRSTLAEEARSLRIFYADPRPHLARGEFVDFPNDMPGATITGRSVCIGALWVRPDYRRLGLTKILSRTCKAYACEQWSPSVLWALVNPAHLDSGVARAFGSITVCRGARLCMAGQDLPAAVSYQDRRRFLADIAKDMDQGVIDSSRLIVTALTYKPEPAARHGMTNRS